MRLGKIHSWNATGEYTTDELVQMALAQGGAVGQAAERFANPKKSFFSTLTEGSLKVFDTVVTGLQTGGYAVRGIIDPTITVGEAIKGRQTVGEYLVDDAGPGASKMEKFAVGTVRFALDTLLDPLTYVTFGSARGVLGLYKGAEAIAGEQLAKNLGIQEGKRISLSVAGEEKAAKLYESKRKGLRETYLKNERIKMVNEGRSADEISEHLRELDDSVSDMEIAEILNSKLDMADASQTIANIAGRFPHMMDDWIDKGGIKFFGQTILSSQRIGKLADALPGMTLLDRATLPVRKAFGNKFNPDFQDGTRMSDEFITQESKARDAIVSQGRQLTKVGYRLKKELDLTAEEWEFISAAIEHGLKPRDPRAADVWNIVHGVAPQNGTVREEVWQGMLGVQRLNKTMYKELRDAGLLKSNGFNNYIPHLLVETETKEVPLIPKIGAMRTDRASFAKISTLIDTSGERKVVRFKSAPDENGDTVIEKLVDGKLVEEKLKFVDVSKELKRLDATSAERVGKIKDSLSRLTENIDVSKSLVKGSVADKLVDSLVKMLDDTPGITPQDKKMLSDAVSKFVSDTDVDKIIKGRLKRFYKNGVKISGGGSVSKEDIDQLVTKLVMNNGDATYIVSQLNKLMKSGVNLPHQKKAMPGKSGNGRRELAELANKIKTEANVQREKIFNRKLDNKAVVNLLKQMVAITSKNPKGLSSVIDKIINDKQLALDLKDELSDIAKAYEIEKQQIIKDGGRFVSEDGASYERVRAHISEAKELGVNFEENALVVSLSESHKAVKLAATKHFIEDVARKFGRPMSMADSSYVPINKEGLKFEGNDLSKWLTSKEGEELVFHPSVASRITDFVGGLSDNGEVSKFFRAYDSLQNYFKASVTSIFPSFHGRNALSNVFLMFNRIGYHSLNPANHVATANMMNLQVKTAMLQKKMIKGTADMKEWNELMRTKVIDGWSWGELRKVMIDNMVAFHPKNTGYVDQITFGQESVGEATRKLFPKDKKGKLIHDAKPFNPLSKDNALFSAGFSVSQTIEDYARALTFISQLKGTKDPLQAARITKQALFDYTNLSKFEKEVVRRLVPFYTFTRKNLELQVNTLLTTPGRIATQVRGVKTLGEIFGEGELTQEEKEALPEWAVKGYSTVISRYGSHIKLLGTLGSPLEEFLGRTDGESNLMMLSPLVKVPIEMMSGYSLFYGKHISEVTNADKFRFAPKAIQDFIGYEEVTYTDKDGKEQIYYTSFNPENMHLLTSIPVVGRIMSEINKISKQDTADAKVVAGILGFSPQEYDIDEERAKRERENKERLMELLDQANVMYSFKRYAVTKE